MISEISKYIHGVTSDVGDCVDASLCPYDGFFFPQITCILHACKVFGVDKFKQKAQHLNATRMTDKRRFKVKV